MVFHFDKYTAFLHSTYYWKFSKKHRDTLEEFYQLIIEIEKIRIKLIMWNQESQYADINKDELTKKYKKSLIIIEYKIGFLIDIF